MYVKNIGGRNEALGIKYRVLHKTLAQRYKRKLPFTEMNKQKISTTCSFT